MRIRMAVAIFLVLAGLGAAFVASQPASNDAAAAGPFRMIVPNVASDSAPQGAQPTPTPTPTGGAANDPERWVMIAITITAQEPALTETGTAPIRMFASARARLPTALSGPITVTGTVTMSEHEPDPDCTWSRTFTKPDFGMTVYYSGDLSVLVTFTGPEWYWTARCPQEPPKPTAVFRFPADGAELQFGYYLGLPLGVPAGGAPLGIRTDIYAGYASGSGCLKRWAQLQGSAFNGDAAVDVWVYEPGYPGGCLLPLLP